MRYSSFTAKEHHLNSTNESFPRICLFGDGMMSRSIRKLAGESGITVTNVFTGDELRNGLPRKRGELKGAEVGLDFSSPDAVLGNVRRSVDMGLPLVVGTTGWLGTAPEVEAVVLNGDGAMLHSPNFSFAANVLFHLLDRASSIFGSEGGFDPYIWERHHSSKGDAPSGTALHMGEVVLGNMAGKDLLQVGPPKGVIAENQLSVSSVRAGSSPGIHIAGFDGRYESLELVHQVRDRTAYSTGALVAASWLVGRKGIYTMDDVMRDLEVTGERGED